MSLAQIRGGGKAGWCPFVTKDTHPRRFGTYGWQMLNTKGKGDLAELKVACDLVSRGHQIAIPYGEDWDFDLIVFRHGQLERVQVKHTSSKDGVVAVKCFSNSLTNGKVRRVKQYTAAMIDWIAIYDSSTDRCFYVPAAELGKGRRSIHLRLEPARNGQLAGTRSAEDYAHLPRPPADNEIQVEPAGLEPATSRMQTGRSPN